MFLPYCFPWVAFVTFYSLFLKLQLKVQSLFVGVNRVFTRTFTRRVFSNTAIRMQSSSSVKWFPLKLKNPVELKLDVTLQCGQSFRWRQTKLDNQSVWVGPIGISCDQLKSISNFIAGSTVFGLKEQDDDLYFTTFPLTESSLNEELLKKYFMLDLSLSKLKEEWSTADPNFKKLASTGRFDGLRLLQLDPVECLFCFICSQNNNIKRITKMVESLCTKYGKVLQTVNDIPIYQFPTVQDLATNADEDTLRALGMSNI